MALYIQHFKAYLFCRSVSKWEHKKTASGTSFFCSWAMHTHSSLGKYLGISSFERLERSSGHILSHLGIFLLQPASQALKGRRLSWILALCFDLWWSAMFLHFPFYFWILLLVVFCLDF